MKNYYESLEWDEWNIDKITVKHKVFVREVEDAFINPNVILPHPKVKDRRILLGVSDGGRYLFVVFRKLSKVLARPITARDMIRAERRFYENQISKH